jgi:hypothetical protein
MNKKYFDLIETAPLTAYELSQIEKRKQRKLNQHAKKIREISIEKVKEKIELKHTKGRVIISIDIEAKNSHTFGDGSKIYIGRQFNNLNRRETEPVNAYVISGEGVTTGAEILIHPNAIIDSNKIFSFKEDISDVKYYSIPKEQCYIWKNENNEWLPLENFATALRVFEEYKGLLVGVEHKLIPNVLYITSGSLKGKVVHTLKACDYEIIFMGSNGVEERVIRCRHFEKETNEREEIVGIDIGLTSMVKKGDLLIGISSNDAKSIIFTP